MATKVYEEIKQKYKNKKVLVVGLGLLGGGEGVAKFFAELGSKVTVTDKKTDIELSESLEKLKGLPIKYRLGEHRLEDFLNADVIFKGPSVPWTMPELQQAQQQGVSVEMELPFVASYHLDKTIGVTGTRGKSTTTHLIYQILKSNNYSILLGGSLAHTTTINLLKNLKKDDWILMELPSWPLSGFHQKKLSPHISVFTNFYPDHLNYYKSLTEYFYDKKAIYLYQNESDYLIANSTLTDTISIDNIRSITIYFNPTMFPGKLNNLKGEHNLENAAAALQVAKVFDIDEKKAVKIINEFKGVPYRQEQIAEKNKIIFINDTTSTTPIATIRAIQSYTKDRIVLILGGNSKNLPVEDLIAELEFVEKIILLPGSFTNEILPILKDKYINKIIGPFDSLEEIVKRAYDEALKLDNERSKIAILFSPGATSFATFKNEFDRGDKFNEAVRQLK